MAKGERKESAASRQKEKERVERERQEKSKEDAKWEDQDPRRAKKEQREKEKEQKNFDSAAKKAEAKCASLSHISPRATPDTVSHVSRALARAEEEELERVAAKAKAPAKVSYLFFIGNNRVKGTKKEMRSLTACPGVTGFHPASCGSDASMVFVWMGSIVALLRELG
jgi:hypothetical protein